MFTDKTHERPLQKRTNQVKDAILVRLVEIPKYRKLFALINNSKI